MKRLSRNENFTKWEAFHRTNLSMYVEYLTDANDETLDLSVRKYAGKCARHYKINVKYAVKKLDKLGSKEIL